MNIICIFENTKCRVVATIKEIIEIPVMRKTTTF